LVNPGQRKAPQGARRTFAKPGQNPMATIATAEEEAAPNW